MEKGLLCFPIHTTTPCRLCFKFRNGSSKLIRTFFAFVRVDSVGCPELNFHWSSFPDEVLFRLEVIP